MHHDKLVLVLLGGDSPEREVSLRSGQAVFNALKQSGYKTDNYDTIDGLDRLKEFAAKYDVILPILHGKNGEDGVVQKELENLGLKYLGTSSRDSALCFDKVATHKILEAKGIRMPRSMVVDVDTFRSCSLKSKPFVVKPIDGGSSVDTILVRDPNNYSVNKINELLSRHNTMIIEELIDGLEITVPVLCDKSLPVIAIIPPQGREFDYENKYNGKTREICPVPEDLLSTKLQADAQLLALKVHKILKARHLSRIDMIYSASGEFVVLELNTIPGLTPQSLYPKSAKVAGYEMNDLVEEFVNLALGG